eukprot:CAMPEP_0185924912 /NCGR_PEP_ID=MMETSP0924C-20121207/13072_1 /TAXON_ID=321610 /ORGANISM="Perkinsus chesapeaki, Strain ATCC PRA-65" /LENGTH=45 /DNA_ID= /DNA_START= /DNA_END= /DNA_ORIENTATION=
MPVCNILSLNSITALSISRSSTTTLPKSDIIEVAAAAAEVTDDSH